MGTSTTRAPGHGFFAWAGGGFSRGSWRGFSNRGDLNPAYGTDQQANTRIYIKITPPARPPLMHNVMRTGINKELYYIHPTQTWTVKREIDGIFITT